MARKRRKFTPEFEAEAGRLCKVGDRSIGQVAKDLDLTETTLREWVRRIEMDAGQGPPGALTAAEREELTRLRKQVRRLEMEKEILKKIGGLLREGERVKFAFIAAEKATVPGRSPLLGARRLEQRVLRVARLPGSSLRARPRREHEPQGRLLGQCRRRKLLRDFARRAARPRALRHPPRCRHRHRRLHRPLLQPGATALVDRLRQPRGI